MIKQKFEVPAEFRDKRLDIFLTAVLKLTRSQVQKMIRKGLVKVNDKTPSVHHWLKEGDEICVEERMMAPKISPQEPPLDIAAETNDYMVIIKPVGVITHPAAGSSALALTDVLVKHNPGMALVGEASRPGIVHRLDRDVGGLLVVAKKYTALVEGVVPQAEGVLDFVMARSKTYPGRMAARPKGQEGRVAETCYTVIKKFPHRTLLELELVTGRTHQIRAHLKAFRHPIVGDKLYGTRKKNAKKPVSDLNHPFLQATTLGFFDLNGEWQEFTVPLESELQNFLNTLS